MTLNAAQPIDWNEVDTVLLDMDGTVLDLHFDNVFWSELLPRRFGEHHGLPLDEARAEMQGHFVRLQATLDFYCLDAWSELTGLDIIGMKEELAHLITWRAGSVRFLEAVRAAGKRVLLVTNAHRGSIDVKHRQTQLLEHFHGVASSHDFGHPKEDQAFWHALGRREPFRAERSLFVDDNLTVLESADTFGVRWLATIDQPDSQGQVRPQMPWRTVNRLDELL